MEAIIRPLYWEFTDPFSKFVEYCSSDLIVEIKFIYLQFIRVLVFCVHFRRNLGPFRARKPRNIRGGGTLCGFLALNGLKSRRKCAQNTSTQWNEFKVGKLYFHNKSSILGFLKMGKIPQTKSYNSLHFARFRTIRLGCLCSHLSYDQFSLLNLFHACRKATEITYFMYLKFLGSWKPDDWERIDN